MSSRRNAVALVLLGLAVTGCQSPAPQPAASSSTAAVTDLRASYAAAASGAPVYTLDSAASTIRLYVFRGGRAAKAGHNHVLSTPSFEGYAVIDPDRPADSRFDLRVPLDTLVIDDPTWRAQTGGTFASPRSESDIAGTHRNLLGPKGLDAARFPFVELRSQAVAGDWPVLVPDVAITLKGVTRVQPVLVRLTRDGEAMRARGEFVLRQSDFGIEPFSVLGGLMAVQDAVAVTFDLVARPGLRPEPRGAE